MWICPVECSKEGDVDYRVVDWRSVLYYRVVDCRIVCIVQGSGLL